MFETDCKRRLDDQTAGESLEGVWRRKDERGVSLMPQRGECGRRGEGYAVKNGANNGIGQAPPVPVQNLCSNRLVAVSLSRRLLR
jgi:hypothetical protein